MDDDEYTRQSSYQAQVKEDLNLLVSNFDNEQLERYNLYRETGLKAPQVKRILVATGMYNVPPTVLPLIGGVAKVFVGEVVEKAREVQAVRKESGPLSPEHLREAYRLYTIESGHIGAASPARGKRLFVR
ncbi:TAFII28-domain-containing protein [Cantharellus anzutake]|uniref:TAFII28-domain-containing protein n=1 Tax=Cantharellus anzutake TaxID=1750568 RepID=UPI001905B59A|nr:TAFII28-domain-containing protein [Cantharellus anzutake]KAF8337598.1 TAFII28-domain-containing protein [Cantharellus anzutake]